MNMKVRIDSLKEFTYFVFPTLGTRYGWVHDSATGGKVEVSTYEPRVPTGRESMLSGDTLVVPVDLDYVELMGRLVDMTAKSNALQATLERSGEDSTFISVVLLVCVALGGLATLFKSRFLALLCLALISFTCATSIVSGLETAEALDNSEDDEYE